VPPGRHRGLAAIEPAFCGVDVVVHLAAAVGNPSFDAVVRDNVGGAVPMLTHESPLHPSGLYGASKVWGEALGRHYADAHGLSVICVRIGRVRPEDRPQSPREFTVWCSQRDIARFLERCIAAPSSVRFDIFFATSNNRWGYRDLTHARDVLGWEPLDRAEDYR